VAVSWTSATVKIPPVALGAVALGAVAPGGKVTTGRRLCVRLPVVRVSS